jgi:CheY-like chemotaxis protein
VRSSAEKLLGLLNDILDLSKLETGSIAPESAPLSLRGPDNRRLISFHLREAGAEVVIAENGRVACDLVHDAEARGEPFAMVLMDIQMPVLDGYRATAELRRAGYRRPTIAVTAHTSPSDRARCRAAGCDDFLAKPLSRESLLETVRRHAGSADGSPPVARAALRAQPPEERVTGVEPATLCLASTRSSQLSYTRRAKKACTFKASGGQGRPVERPYGHGESALGRSTSTS